MTAGDVVVNEPIKWDDYFTMRAALNAWRERRNISFDTLDILAGTAERSSVKVFGPHAARRIGMETLLDYLASLAIKGTFEHDPKAFEELKHRLVPRNSSQVRRSGAIKIEFSRRYMQKIGRNGAKKRWDAKRKRSAGASKAAKVRWKKAGRELGEASRP
jgi:hypothetical protein